MMTGKQKALKINLDPHPYGSFSEIGCGQDVAAHFFRAGGATGTVAKTLSAYDMTISDIIYGPCERYVSKPRLLQMLTREYDVLQSRLSDNQKERAFFAFANTIAAKGYKGKGTYHGWFGIRFQHCPGAPTSDLLIHIKLLDNANLFQQQAVGELGVNMIYASLYQRDSIETLIKGLMDSLTTERIVIDTIQTTGPAFSQFDDRLLSLELVKNGFTPTIMFSAEREVVWPTDALYKKEVVLLRGSFNPPTKLTCDMFKKASIGLEHPVHVAEISMNKLLEKGRIDSDNFMTRIDYLNALGINVLVSHFSGLHHLASELNAATKRPLTITMRVNALTELFNEDNYNGYSGGLFHAFGLVFGNQNRVFVYPEMADDNSGFIDSSTVAQSPKTAELFAYFSRLGQIIDIVDYEESIASIWTKTLKKQMESSESEWHTSIPVKILDDVKNSLLATKPTQTQ